MGNRPKEVGKLHMQCEREARLKQVHHCEKNESALGEVARYLDQPCSPTHGIEALVCAESCHWE